MEFKDFLKEAENFRNERADICRRIKSHNLPVILFGAGVGARMLTDAFCNYDVEVSGYAVDDKYYKEGSTFLNRPVYRISTLLEEPEKYIFIPAVDELHGNKMTFLNNEKLITYMPSMMDVAGYGVDSSISDISRDDLLKNKDKFAETFSFMSDELSRKVMLAWLKQKIIGDCSYILPVYDESEYFNDLAKPALNSAGGYVDCGTYDGATVERFIRWSGGKYTKIFAFEPDAKNFVLLEKLMEEKNYKNVLIFNAGVWDKKTQLSFSAQNDMASNFSDDGIGTDKVDVVKIDDVVGDEPVNLIKMDIEGSELRALEGARATITNNKPVLEICAYHRTEDLITLPQFIKSIHPDYKLYLRKHSFCSEFNLVLYAVP